MKRIIVVFEEATSSELINLLSDGDVWIASTAKNRVALDSLTRNQALPESTGEITLISPEDDLSEVLSEIFLHHNPSSFDGPFSGDWSEIIVRGRSVAEVGDAIAEHDSLRFVEDSIGVHITRAS